MNKEKKVYCKDCRHDRYEGSYGCKKRVKLKKNDYIGQFSDDNLIKEEENGNGECKYYQRTWWRFWV